MSDIHNTEQGSNNGVTDTSKVEPTFPLHPVNNTPPEETPVVEPVVPPVVDTTKTPETPVVEPIVPPVAEVPVVEKEEVVEMHLTDDGDLVDGEGNVVKKKGEFELDTEGNPVIYQEPEGDEEILRLRQNVIDEYGLALQDADGNDLVFADTDEGHTSLIKAAAVELRNRDQANLWKQYPKVEAYLQHQQAGGNDSQFFNIGSKHRDTKFPEATDDNKESLTRMYKDTIVEKFMVSRNGHSLNGEAHAKLLKEAEGWYNYKHSIGEEKETADEDLAWLQGNETFQEKERDENNANAIQKAQDDNNAFWENVKGIVDKGELAGMKIPKAERGAFFDYMARPANKEGQSQESIDAAKEDQTLALQLRYYRFKGYNLDDLVKNRATTIQANKLRSLKKVKVKIINKGAGAPRGAKKLNLDHLTVGALTNNGTNKVSKVSSNNGISTIE